METLIQDSLIGVRLEQYEVERLVGVGGMAHVYLARDTLLGREVAIKALAPDFLTHGPAVERFKREAQRVAALEHPHIAPVLHMIEEGQRRYLVMPLFAQSLRERLRREQSLEVPEAVRIVSEIGSALAVAHAHGLVHRDVKPGNILLNHEGSAFLCDFGIACKAKDTDDAETLTLAGSGLPVGTPLYMAPEQLRGDELDQRADIYALGVVLYEALTGRPPHMGNSLVAIATSALTNPITPPSILNPAVTRPVERVILRALSKHPADRYASVTRFVAALQRAEREAPDPAPETAMRPLPALLWRGVSKAAQPWPAVSPRLAHTTKQRSGWAGVAITALALTLALAGGLIFTNPAELSGAAGPASGVDGIGAQRASTPVATASPTTAATKTPAPKTPTPRPAYTTTPPTPKPTGATAASTSTPPLAVSALHLTRSHGNQCVGVQTIANSGAQPIAWQWESVSPAPHPSLGYGVNTSMRAGGLPADRSPGVAPGSVDTLNVQMKCAGQRYTVTLRDSLGRTQQFTITSDTTDGESQNDN